MNVEERFERVDVSGGVVESEVVVVAVVVLVNEAFEIVDPVVEGVVERVEVVEGLEACEESAGFNGCAGCEGPAAELDVEFELELKVGATLGGLILVFILIDPPK